MPTKLEAMLELERRGKLPANYQELLAEARSRGLMSPAEDQPSSWPSSAADTAGSFLTSAVDAVPVVGPYMLGGLERAGAAGRSMMSGRPFEEELAGVRGQTEQAQKEHSWAATAGGVTGAVAGLAPLAATGAGAAALGLRGGMGLRTALGAATGAAMGGGDSAVRSGGDWGEIKRGAKYGFAGGLAAPSLGKAVGYGARKGMSALTRPGGPLATVSRPAAEYAAKATSKIEEIATLLQRLGKDATLADVSPEWRGVARAAGGRPGHRDEIVGFFNRRGGDAANQRLRADLDTHLGPTRDPSTIESSLADARTALSPQYARALDGAQAVNTQPIADEMDTMAVNLRGPAQQAVQRVRGYLNIPGQQALDPNPRALLETRHAIDGLMAGEVNPQVQRVLTIARQHVEGELGRAAPGIKQVDERFADLSRQSEALQRGSQVLDAGKTAVRPTDLETELRVASALGRQRMQQGARAEIDRITGLQANDPAAAQRLMQGTGDWNRQKLDILYGPARSKAALDAIDRETTFYRTANQVTEGSDTDMSKRFGDFLDAAATPPKIPVDATLVGTTGRALQAAVQAVRGARADQQAEKFAGDLGRLSVATGPTRDELLSALQEYMRRKASGEPIANAAANVGHLTVMGGVEEAKAKPSVPFSVTVGRPAWWDEPSDPRNLQAR